MLLFAFCRLCVLEGIRCEEERIIIIESVCVVFWLNFMREIKRIFTKYAQSIGSNDQSIKSSLSLSLSLSNSVLFNPPGQVEVSVLVGDVVTLVSVERAFTLENQVSQAVRRTFPRGSPTRVFAQRRVVAFDQVFESFDVIVLRGVFDRERTVVDFTREYFLV